MSLSRRIHPAVMLLASWPTFAPPVPTPAGVADGEVQTQPIFRAGTEAVRLDVIVTERGTPISGLTARDFEVFDNGVAQTPTVVAQGDSVTVLPVLDTSGSVAGARMLELAAAARSLVGLLGGSDHVGFLTFADRPTLRVPLTTGTLGPPAISAAIGSVQAGGGTAMYDALVAGLMLVAPDAGGALLLLFSDGADTASYLTAGAALEAVKRAGVVVYVVAAGLPASENGHPSADGGLHERFLRSVIEASGGRLLRAEFSRKRLGGVFAQILTEFRTRYVITYIPEGVGRDDGWHPVRVSLRSGVPGTGSAGRRAAVRVRTGYYASGPAQSPTLPQAAALAPSRSPRATPARPASGDSRRPLPPSAPR